MDKLRSVTSMLSQMATMLQQVRDSGASLPLDELGSLVGLASHELSSVVATEQHPTQAANEVEEQSPEIGATVEESKEDFRRRSTNMNDLS